ncbi:MAG TPA: glycosyltransferase, partial [Gammaproteobacteria bacterium]|nr:glycosyltransferase [Gammaproteobacteria bacterium]
MKCAIVCDWLVTLGGAEKFLGEILHCFPEADLFAVIDFVDADKRDFLLNKKIRTTFIQNLPFAKQKYRHYLPLMPLAIEQLDLSAYDLIISSSHAVAKGVITGPDQVHISYVHSPMRYAWDLQHQYLRESGLDKQWYGYLARYFLHKLRQWDLRSANGVDYFIANSHYIARRIEKTYRRPATVIYPPVDISHFIPQGNKEDFYLTASRLVPYKRIDLIVESFQQLPDKKLIVIG